MAKYFATGTKQFVTMEPNEQGKMEKTSRTASVVIDLSNIDPRNVASYAIAQNEVKRIAKKEKITVDGFGVRIVQGTQKGGSTMTKNAKKRRLEKTKQHKDNWRKNLLKKQA